MNLRSGVNPYKERLNDYPGKIFCFHDFDSDVKTTVEEAKRREAVFCDIGSGSGGFLINLAQNNPRAAFFGFELRYKRSVRTIEKSQRLGLSNVFVLRTKAESITEIFPDCFISGVYINFPEPWEKAKWRKHQLLNSSLLIKLERLLKNDGFIAIKTDQGEYLNRFILESQAFTNIYLAEFSSDLYQSSYLVGNIKTEFEGLFCAQGLPIHYARFVIKK